MATTPNNVGEMKPYWNLSEEEDEEASSIAWLLLIDCVKLGVLKAVIDLDVLEIIKACGPGAHLSATEIASKLPASNPETAAANLGRMLDVLASHSLLTATPTTLPGGAVQRRYGLAPASKFLIPNEDGVSLAPFLHPSLHNGLNESLNCLKEAFVEGSVPFTKAHGMSFYDYIGKDAIYQESFGKSMADHSTIVMRKILRTYKGFEGLSSLVDVGGNSGAMLGMILSQYPTIRGINFDEPHVIANAPSYPGVQHVGGSIFDKIPKGDAMFLKLICHCFSDEQCITILKNCYAALPEDQGKVIICEYLFPDHAHEVASSDIAAKSVIQFDAMMMILHGGKERTKNEYKSLAMAAGFQGFQVVCSAYNVSIMELLKKK